MHFTVWITSTEYQAPNKQQTPMVSVNMNIAFVAIVFMAFFLEFISQFLSKC